MLFWRNPEFVRYFRAEVRPARALTVAALALVICTLVGLSSWGTTEQNRSREFFQTFYFWTMGIQYVVLTFWCASACGHAISREREMKTFDFLKTTRLTAGELLVGKMLGVPVLAYFTLGCSLPVSIVLGIMGGYSVVTVFWTYVLLLALGLFVSVMALWASMQVEGTSARSVWLLVLIPVTLSFSFAETAFPGFGALSIFPALLSLYGADTDLTRVIPTLFGWPVSFALLTLILYASFGGWFALMLIRNFKKDLEEIRLLSRWQAIGFAVFLNVLFYAFLDPKRVGKTAGYNRGLSPHEVSFVAMGLNAMALFVIGIAMLSPPRKTEGLVATTCGGRGELFFGVWAAVALAGSRGACRVPYAGGGGSGLEGPHFLGAVASGRRRSGIGCLPRFCRSGCFISPMGKLNSNETAGGERLSLPVALLHRLWNFGRCVFRRLGVAKPILAGRSYSV